MVLRITNGFAQTSNAKLIVRATNIWTAMSNSPYFTTPVPSLADFKDQIDAFAADVAEAEGGSTFQKAIRDQVKQIVIGMMHALANYVLFTANGDLIVAQSSGFTIAKPPTPAPPITDITNQKLEDGATAGQLHYSFDKVRGARGYVYQYAQDPITDTSAWQTLVGTVSKATFNELEVGKKYWVRVIAIGTNGQGVYSTPISRIVQ
jgi:hypothetical protein